MGEKQGGCEGKGLRGWVWLVRGRNRESEQKAVGGKRSEK